MRPALPAALYPTLAIEAAPPAVAGNAYWSMSGGRLDTIALMLAGYAALMIGVQLRLVPQYRRLTFSPGFWAFTFSYAAVAGLAVRWLAAEHPAGHVALIYLTAGAITAGVLLIAVRTLVALARGSFLPPVPASESPRPAAEQVAARLGA